jgi:hypothetical protein
MTENVLKFEQPTTEKGWDPLDYLGRVPANLDWMGRLALVRTAAAMCALPADEQRKRYADFLEQTGGLMLEAELPYTAQLLLEMADLVTTFGERLAETREELGITSPLDEEDPEGVA